MQRQLTEDITIGGRKYRLGKLTASMASWLYTKVMGQLLNDRDKGDESDLENLSADERKLEVQRRAFARFMGALSRLSQADFFEIQQHVLMAVAVYETKGAQEVPLPIMKSLGVFAYADLQHEPRTVWQLTMKGINFNVDPFFADATE
jgi:hypothetical protein